MKNEIEEMINRLSDSEEYNTDAAVPPVVEDAVALFRKVGDFLASIPEGYSSFKADLPVGGSFEIEAGGDKVWRDEDGRIHREDGPAAEWTCGSKFWFRHGKFHREDGPAVERVNGDKEWYCKGLRHREDGPAVEYANGSVEYWIDGERVAPPKATSAPKSR